MITVNDLKNRDNFFLMAGPCAIEGEDMALRIAEKVVGITNKLNIPYIFKGSYRKANRSRLDSFTGIGDEKALKILRRVGDTFGIPTVTDIHETAEAAMAGPGCRLSGYSSNAAVRLSRYHGRYPLLATTQPNFRCDRRTPYPDRNDSQSSHCRRS